MECQFSIVKTREGTREVVPGDGPQDRVMSPAGVEDIHLAPADFNGPFSIDKVTVESRGITLFKTAQMPG